MKSNQTIRRVTGWAMFTPSGWVFMDSVRHLRKSVVYHADYCMAPGENWDSYRKKGYFIAKIDIVPYDAGRDK